MKKLTTPKLFLVTLLTLFFFASNSLLCRLALQEQSIDAFSFTFFRLFFGAAVLVLILLYKQKHYQFEVKTNWLSAFMLFMYALCFSYAYNSLDAGLGALILFAVVQLSMIIFALKNQEKLTFQKIFGMGLAFLGLCYLLFPKETLVLSYEHIGLMILSGIAWASYTLLGKKTAQALYHTTDNFVKSLFYMLLFSFLIHEWVVSFEGIVLAFFSGAITSGIGYALWYFLLPHISLITASVLQLFVPVIAIFLGVIFLAEVLSFTLGVSTLIILSGILLCLTKKD